MSVTDQAIRVPGRWPGASYHYGLQEWRRHHDHAHLHPHTGESLFCGADTDTCRDGITGQPIGRNTAIAIARQWLTQFDLEPDRAHDVAVADDGDGWWSISITTDGRGRVGGPVLLIEQATGRSATGSSSMPPAAIKRRAL